MGNHFVQSNANEKTVDHPLNMNNFNFSGMFKDDRMGEINELEYIQTKEKVFLKELTLKNVQSLTELHINALYERCKLRHPNLLLTIGFNYSINHSDGIKNMKINLYFEPYKSDLADDIYKRKKINLYYAEHELLTLMDRLVSVLAMLQKNDVAHGNICSQNILINEKDLVKIADHCMLTSEYSQYYQALNGIISNYMAPELMQLLAKSHKNIEIFNDYRHKSDVFALGMLFLELALLDSNDTCYDWKIFALLEKNLIGRVDRVKSKYSKILLNLLTSMLNLNSERRPDFIELKKEIKNLKKTHLEGSSIYFTLDRRSSFSFVDVSPEKMKNPALKINYLNIKNQDSTSTSKKSQYIFESSQKRKTHSSNSSHNDSLLHWMFKSCITPVNTNVEKTLIFSNFTSNDALQNDEYKFFNSNETDINLTGIRFKKQSENMTLTNLDEKILEPKTFKQPENVTLTNFDEKTIKSKIFNVSLEKNNNSFSKIRSNKGSFYNITHSNDIKQQNNEDYTLLHSNHRIEKQLKFDQYQPKSELDNYNNLVYTQKDPNLKEKLEPIIENTFYKETNCNQSFIIKAPIQTNFKNYPQEGLRQINLLEYQETRIPMDASIQLTRKQFHHCEISDCYSLSSPHFGNQYFQFPQLRNETLDNSSKTELLNYAQSIRPHQYINNKNNNSHSIFTFGDGTVPNTNFETNFVPIFTATQESRPNTPTHNNNATHLNFDISKSSQKDYQIASNKDQSLINVLNSDPAQIKTYSSIHYSNNMKIMDSEFYLREQIKPFGHQFSENAFLPYNNIETSNPRLYSEYLPIKQPEMRYQTPHEHSFLPVQIEQWPNNNLQNQDINTNLSLSKDSIQIIQSQNTIYPIKDQNIQHPQCREEPDEIASDEKKLMSPLKFETSKYKLKAPIITISSSLSSERITNNKTCHNQFTKLVKDEENKITNQSISKDKPIVNFYNPNLKNVPMLNSNFSIISYNNIGNEDANESDTSMVSSSLSY